VIEFHYRENYRWKERAEEHAGLRRLDRAIDGIENAVTEDAMAV
jgi:hypothetical protein